MDLGNYLKIEDADRRRFEEVYARYRRLHEEPDQCRPMIIIDTPLRELPTWEERLAAPEGMLKAELEILRPHLELEDDRVPTVRVQFGTAQIATAFGCEYVFPKNDVPAAGTHVLAEAKDVYELEVPPIDAAWYGKLAEWTDIWKGILPEGIHIQLPDIQSAFNSAHLIRGNDIFTDFFDYPAELEMLLKKVTDFMLAITPHMKAMISDDPDWFFDWGAMWKGTARISNCSMQMISPQLYREHVLTHDIRFLESIGGGRIHYCGITGEVIDDYFRIPTLTGLDIDSRVHDFFDLCDRAPEKLVLLSTGPFEYDSDILKRLLRGDWPEKRNFVLSARAPSIEAGKVLLGQLRDAMPY